MALQRGLGSLTLGKVLGEGSYGTVHLATDNLTGNEYAVKVYNKEKLNAEALARVFFEADIMKSLPHKNIVKVYNVIEEADKVYIVMKYAKSGDLLEFVRTKKQLSEAEAREIFIQIFEALDYTHNQNVIHRDIKLENILVDENNEIMLADWGFADYWSLGKKIKCSWGSLFYAAPEVFLGTEYTGPEIDVWSLGVVLYAMTCGKLPFSGADNTEIANNIVEGAYKVPNFCSKTLCNLLTSMLRVEPLHRINMNEIRCHPWMLTTASHACRKSMRLSTDETNGIVHGSVLQRENKKSAIGAFFNKLLKRKDSTVGVDQKKSPSSKTDSKVDRKEKRRSVIIPATPQPSQNKRWSVSLGKVKFSIVDDCKE